MASCFHPISVPSPSTGQYHLVPCNKCSACYERKRQAWLLRAQQEMKVWKYCYFISLSYCDDFLPYESYSRKSYGKPVNPVSTGESLLHPYDLRKFFMRYRYFSGQDFAYFACGEYGSDENTRRPHFHICLFCNTNWQDTLLNVRLAWSYLRPESKDERNARYRLARKLGHRVSRDAWSLKNRVPIGRDQVRCLTYRRITYVSKYVTKQIGCSDVVPPFYRSSKRLGMSFLNSAACAQLKSANKHYYYLESGLPCALPRVYSQHMFTKEQMEQFQMDLIINECPYLPEDFASYDDFYECCKTYYKSRRSSADSRRRRFNLAFQGVRLL